MSEPRFAAAALDAWRLAAQLLGWRAAEFWAATPTELASALAPPDSGSDGLSRSELTRMMERDDAIERR